MKKITSWLLVFSFILTGTANGAMVDRVIISGSKLTAQAAETAVGGMFGKVTGEVSIYDSTVRRLVIKTAGDATTVGSFVGYAENVADMNNCAVVNSYVNSEFVNYFVLNGTK